MHSETRISRYWNRRRVLVTGGASFIGSHLTEALIERGAKVRVVDDLSSGKIEHIQPLLEKGVVEFRQEDLLDPAVARMATKAVDTVFHLAARHGGRGYIDEHDVECSRNVALDSHLFHACLQSQVEKVVYASSGCVYPLSLQRNSDEVVYLAEGMAGPPYEADNVYGWAKLMGEMTLKAYYERHGLKSAICRYFTAYGPRCSESHAVMAFIARGFRREIDSTYGGTAGKYATGPTSPTSWKARWPQANRLAMPAPSISARWSGSVSSKPSV